MARCGVKVDVVDQQKYTPTLDNIWFRLTSAELRSFALIRLPSLALEGAIVCPILLNSKGDARLHTNADGNSLGL